MNEKIYLLSLGCARNLVDSEVILGILKDNNYNVTYDIDKCDVAILSTCVFIKEAKEESIEYLLDLVRLKEEGKIKKIIVTGCFCQRYPEAIKKEIPQVDAIIGFDRYLDIHKAVKLVLSGRKLFWVTKEPSFIYNDKLPRVLLSPPHFAYVKISEGCNHSCSFCVIPGIKGRLRSRPINSILREIENLTSRGVKEIILIGQDTTAYGVDIYKKPHLARLLKEISEAGKMKWLRLLYGHPAYFNDTVISCYEKYDKICRYIDLPLQHINNKILGLMGRPQKTKDVIKLIKKIRQRIPGSAIRTSFIVGFPRETDKNFQELIDFVKEIKFERLGVFKYSKEENTPAYNYKGQVPEKKKEARYRELMLIQQDISEKINSQFLNKRLKVIIDKKVEGEPEQYLGRTEYDAPDVDGQVYIKSGNPRIKPGTIIKVLVKDTYEYDLVADHVR